MAQISLHAPVGDITVTEEEGRIVSLDWGWVPEQRETPLLAEARHQLDRYFDGAFAGPGPGPAGAAFDLPLAPPGSAFQQRVWRAMLGIPLGRTASYGELARGLASSARAVGGACGRNPIPILVPCHRVLAAAGGAGGYSGAGGLETKRLLLALEGVTLRN